MKAGRLDQRIQIETPSSEADGLGQTARTWLLLDEVWAAVREVAGREFLAGDARAEEKATFTIRWRDDFDSTARVQWGGRTWRIDSTTGTRRSGERWLHCVTTEGAN